MTEQELAERLERIQALFAGATTEGERAAAAAARERVEERLKALRQCALVETRFTLNNPWSRRLLVALLRKHGYQPYRRRGQRYTTVMARVPDGFVNEALWPEFLRLDETLQQYFEEVATRVIAKAIHADQADAAVEPAGALEASA